MAPNFAQGHFNYGIALKTSGRFTDAIAAYQQAIALEPNYAEAHQNLGVVLMKVGHFQEAIASFTRAIQLHEQQQNYETAEILRSALQEFR
ncbi:MAG: tetratricopeptide repeat protein [Pseudanabaena sp. LacPavin_0818_WC45_MAG_42_6]|nr:tetratricopeptide repeat protein [Pseudanabaena sp. LacPavin_0818_WC45_MAG_42_6]